MAVKPIIIPLVADTGGLSVGIEALEQLGQIDAKTAADFKAANKAFQDRGKVLDQASGSTDKLAQASKKLVESIAGGAIAQATANIEKLRQKTDSTNAEFITLTKTIQLAKQQLNSLGKDTPAFDQLSQEIQAAELAMGNFESAAESSRAQLRQYREALLQLEEAGLENTRVFTDMAATAGQLQDSIGDTQARIKALSSDTFLLDGSIQIIQGVAGAFSLAQGAAALFGDESDEVQQALLKVNAAMAILNGLQQLQNILQKQSTANLLIENTLRRLSAANTVLQSLAESRFTIVRVLATGAQNALNAAMAANPAGVLLLAISAAAGALLLFANNSDRAADSQGELADQSRRVVEALNAEIDIQERLRNTRQGGLNSIRQEIAELQARGATRSQILALEGRALEEEIQNLKVRQQSLAENAASQDEFDKVSTEIAERQSERAIKSIEEQKARADEGREITKKALEDQKKATQDFLKDQIAANEAALIESRDGFEKLVAQIALINAKLRLELANSDLGPNERLAAELRAGEAIKKARQDLLGDLQKVGQQESDFRNRSINEQVLSSAQRAQKELEIRQNQANEEKRIIEESVAQEKQIRQSAVEAAFQLSVSLSQSLSEIATNNANAQVAALQDQLERGLITQEQFDQRSRAIRRRAAQQEKQFALFQATVNAAAAIIKVFQTTGPPLSFVLAATTAAATLAQIAAIASKPIPAFEKGTKNAPGGLSLIGEAGPELYYASGKWGYASQATLLDLPKGAKVIPSIETESILKKYDIPIPNVSQNVTYENGNSKLDYKKLGDIIGKQISRIPVNVYGFDKNGPFQYVTSLQSRAKYIGNKFSSGKK